MKEYLVPAVDDVVFPPAVVGAGFALGRRVLTIKLLYEYTTPRV